MATVSGVQGRMEALLRKCQKVFQEGPGWMNTFEASLLLKPQAVPKFLKARSVPFALKEAIDLELDPLRKLGSLKR